MKKGELTEERIKQAAKLLFQQKGYAAVKTREIAEASGINLALLNYYFRSKENLFQQIMAETMRAFMQRLLLIMMQPETDFRQKIIDITEGYLDLLEQAPNLPLFIMNNLGTHADELFGEMQPDKVFTRSFFAQQYREEINANRLPDQPLVQFVCNLLSLIVFPYIASPMLSRLAGNEENFEKMRKERKKMIPVWIENMYQK